MPDCHRESATVMTVPSTVTAPLLEAEKHASTFEQGSELDAMVINVLLSEPAIDTHSRNEYKAKDVTLLSEMVKPIIDVIVLNRMVVYEPEFRTAPDAMNDTFL